MATLVKKHPLLVYYLLTFAISWGGFVIAVGPGSLVNANWQAEGGWTDGQHRLGTSPEKDVGFPYRSYMYS